MLILFFKVKYQGLCVPLSKKLKYYNKETEIRERVYKRGNIGENNKAYAILIHNIGVYYEKKGNFK